MSTLRAAAGQYLAMRRALGFKLDTQGRQLMSFIGYCEARHAGHITTELALAWAMQTSRGSSDEVYHSRRLMVVRIFARHLAALDPATEVPPEDMLPYHYRRIAPYLYSPAGTGNGSRSSRLPLPRIITSPARQSMSLSCRAAASAPRSPSRASSDRTA